MADEGVRPYTKQVPPLALLGIGMTKSWGRVVDEGVRPYTKPVPGRGLTVGEVGALSDFDDIAVRIADIAAYLAVLGDWFGDELRSSTFP